MIGEKRKAAAAPMAAFEHAHEYTTTKHGIDLSITKFMNTRVSLKQSTSLVYISSFP